VNAIAQTSPLAALRRFARPQPAPEVEQCDFCSVPLPPQHRHLLEGATRKIICACDACALRFDYAVGRYKLVPRDSKRLADFQMSDPQWESFSLPIQLAFFYCNSATNKVIAMYPSPAGATESLLTVTSWENLVNDNPVLTEMQADVETLLVNRLNDAREYYLAPIDVSFELVGLIRLHWRGFSGGDKVWREIEDFFARLNESATIVHTTALTSQTTEGHRA
jgi:hypothetical protein